MWVLFPLFSLNYFEWSDVIAADISLGLSGPVLGLGLFLLPWTTGFNSRWTFKAEFEISGLVQCLAEKMSLYI